MEDYNNYSEQYLNALTKRMENSDLPEGDNIYFLTGLLSTRKSLKKFSLLNKYITNPNLHLHEDGSMESPIPYLEKVVKTSNFIYSLPARKIARMLTKELSMKEGNIIDIGTGPGQFAFELAKLLPDTFKIIGYDVSGNMLDLARGRALGLNLKISFLRGPVIYPEKYPSSGNTLPFADSSFDLIISHGSMHHWLGGNENVAAVKTMLLELYRISKTGGKILIYDINPESIFTRIIVKYKILKLLGGDYQANAFKHSVDHSLTTLRLRQLTDNCNFKNYKIYPALPLLPVGLIFHVLEINKN